MSDCGCVGKCQVSTVPSMRVKQGQALDVANVRCAVCSDVPVGLFWCALMEHHGREDVFIICVTQ